jgi:hypothetical protein
MSFNIQQFIAYHKSKDNNASQLEHELKIISVNFLRIQCHSTYNNL